MEKSQKRSKTMSGHGLTSFRLTKNLLNNLQQFNITPTAKLVLLYLASCYNPNKADMFPKQKTIANKIGVSEISVTRAISELHKEGLIISERKKYTNYYKFTAKILSERAENEQIKLKEERYQFDSRKDINLIPHEHEQITRINKPTNDVEVSKINYIEDRKTARRQDGKTLTDKRSSSRAVDRSRADEILMKAIEQKNWIKNKVAYINVIKRNGGAEQIIEEMRQMEANKRYMQNTTENFLQNFKESKQKSEAPSDDYRNIKQRLRRYCGKI